MRPRRTDDVCTSLVEGCAEGDRASPKRSNCLGGAEDRQPASPGIRASGTRNEDASGTLSTASGRVRRGRVCTLTADSSTRIARVASREQARLRDDRRRVRLRLLDVVLGRVRTLARRRDKRGRSGFTEPHTHAVLGQRSTSSARARSRGTSKADISRVSSCRSNSKSARKPCATGDSTTATSSTRATWRRGPARSACATSSRASERAIDGERQRSSRAVGHAAHLGAGAGTWWASTHP